MQTSINNNASSILMEGLVEKDKDVSGAPPGTSTVKNLPASAGDQDLSLRQRDPLEEEIATRSSIVAWRIPRTEEPVGLQSMGHKESDTTERLSSHTHY